MHEKAQVPLIARLPDYMKSCMFGWSNVNSYCHANMH